MKITDNDPRRADEVTAAFVAAHHRNEAQQLLSPAKPQERVTIASLGSEANARAIRDNEALVTAIDEVHRTRGTLEDIVRRQKARQARTLAKTAADDPNAVALEALKRARQTGKTPGEEVARAQRQLAIDKAFPGLREALAKSTEDALDELAARRRGGRSRP